MLPHRVLQDGPAAFSLGRCATEEIGPLLLEGYGEVPWEGKGMGRTCQGREVGRAQVSWEPQVGNEDWMRCWVSQQVPERSSNFTKVTQQVGGRVRCMTQSL